MKNQALPSGTRRGLVVGAVLLVVIAAAVNISHTRKNALDHGQESLPAMAIGFIPDVMLVLSVMRLRYHRRAGWAWAGVVLSVLLVAWSALSEAGQGHGYGGMIMSLVCLIAAIIATGQAHVPHGGEPVHLLLAHTEALADDTVRSVRAAHEQELGSAQAAHEEALRAAAQAHEALRTVTAQVAALEAAQAHEPTAQNDETAGRAPRAPRTKTARATAPTSDDVAHRKAVRAAFEASVRDGAPLDNRSLACALYDVDEPDSKQVGAARARASEWKRALENGAEAQEAAQ